MLRGPAGLGDASALGSLPAGDSKINSGPRGAAREDARGGRGAGARTLTKGQELVLPGSRAPERCHRGGGPGENVRDFFLWLAHAIGMGGSLTPHCQEGDRPQRRGLLRPRLGCGEAIPSRSEAADGGRRAPNRDGSNGHRRRGSPRRLRTAVAVGKNIRPPHPAGSPNTFTGDREWMKIVTPTSERLGATPRKSHPAS